MAGDDDTAPTGMVDSDDTTQADAGMAGGTGATQDEATATPGGTKPHTDDDETDGSEA